jgi:glycine dehydrogenase subunit 1
MAHPYIPHTDEDRKTMLHALGVSTFDELLSDVPERLRVSGDLSVPTALDEASLVAHMEALAAENETDAICFRGGGAYDHWTPAAVDAIASRPEFVTAYTPYQPEVSQGTLQAIYEFQTMVARLSAMDVANASMYDGASAAAEAAMLAMSRTKRKRVLAADSLCPRWRQVISTYIAPQGGEVVVVRSDNGLIDAAAWREELDDTVAAAFVSSPNQFGLLEDATQIEPAVHDAGALFVVAFDPIAAAVVTPPGEVGADVAVAEGQPLGLPLSYGGPYLGLFAAKRKFVRQMPGRLVGETTDVEGKRGFVMTLQTREQHIRRDKATSNICTNQGLCALSATVHLSFLGEWGFRAVAGRTIQMSHEAAERLADVKGVKLRFPGVPFFREFVVDVGRNADDVLRVLWQNGVQVGPSLTAYGPEYENSLLVAVTEKRTSEDLDRLVEAFEKL